MPYATLTDLVTRFGETELAQLTDRSHTGAAIDAEVVQRALMDADAEIDARLQARYRLPLASVPRLLTNIACDIARYRLSDDRATDQVTRRFEDAVKLLDKIGRGEIHLGLDAADAPTRESGAPKAVNSGRVFSRDKLADYGH
jgi:phage gp36-like protein